MATKFTNFIEEIEQEAAAESPEAVAELEALRVRYQFARELMAIRKGHNLTQAKLAELSGVGQGEISKIENASANPTVTTVAALASALGAELHLVERDRGDRGDSVPAGGAFAH